MNVLNKLKVKPNMDAKIPKGVLVKFGHDDDENENENEKKVKVKVKVENENEKKVKVKVENENEKKVKVKVKEIIHHIPPIPKKVKIELIDDKTDDDPLNAEVLRKKIQQKRTKNNAITINDDKHNSIDIDLDNLKLKRKDVKHHSENENENSENENENSENEKVKEKKIHIIKSTTKSKPLYRKKSIVLSSDNDIDIVEMADRINKIRDKNTANRRKYNMQVSSYYLNNREIFVNFINKLFEPFKEQLEKERKKITCDTLNDQGTETTLLTHQEIISEYMSVYAPYRGILLMHGLGAGKSCNSIAAAEGLSTEKRIIVMTPASLQKNYITEIKKCGDFMYRKNQYWEWISLAESENMAQSVAELVGISPEYVRKAGGIWLSKAAYKSANYNNLTNEEKISLEHQLDEMIRAKYTFINYNGLRRDKFKELTNNFETNIFDNAVIIIDEAHNFISRIVNKINKMSNTEIQESHILSIQMYDFLLKAKNSKIIMLSGTPIINYPNEIAIMFNILRGYIRTYNFTIQYNGTTKLTTEYFSNLLMKQTNTSYIQFSNTSKKLSITLNPYGFRNVIKNGEYKGVTKEDKSENNGNGNGNGNMNINNDIEEIKDILEKNGMKVMNVNENLKKALPDTLDEFIETFIDVNTGEMINTDKFKRRILGLTSYFRSAQEELMPKYDAKFDKHIIEIPMSDYQFNQYEIYRHEERKMENPKNKKGQQVTDELFKEPSSTYRIFSRLACNFVMPDPPGRPQPTKKGKQEEGEGEENEENEEVKVKMKNQNKTKKYKIKTNNKLTKKNKLQIITHKDKPLFDNNIETDYIGGQIDEEEPDDDDNLNKDELEGDALYKKQITESLKYLADHPELLSLKSLETYSPKFIEIYNNIVDENHVGLHLIYSQFRTMEGIGIFSLVLEANGFAQFKIKREVGKGWVIDVKEEDLEKPMFTLYTGTEDPEEKEIIRNIYNSNWDYVPNNIATQLKEMAKNGNNELKNHLGGIIKVFMITSSGAEGINLASTRYVHIMEPYWHDVRVEQVIGRARRICSHQFLDKELQTVEVFIYVMVFTKKQIEGDDAIELRLKDVSKYNGTTVQTSDQKLLEVSTVKAQLNNQLLRNVKETAIDCSIFNKGSKEGLTCYNFGHPKTDVYAYNPDIKQDESDTMAAINKVQVQHNLKVIRVGSTGQMYKIDKETMQIYDYDSGELLGKLIVNAQGNYEIIQEI